MRNLCLVALSGIVSLAVTADLQAQLLDQRAMTAWVQRLAAQHDDISGGAIGDARSRARQDRYLARMSGLPARDELVHVAGDLVRFGYQDLVLTLPTYNPLWKGSVFQADRFAILASRSPQLTPERMDAWESALYTATKSQTAPVWVVLDVLDTDSLFSTGGYRETVAEQFMSRLKSVPAESIDAVAKIVGLALGQAAMYIVGADWAFRGIEFRATTFAQGLDALRKSVPPGK
jgi:hypothetical protein